MALGSATYAADKAGSGGGFLFTFARRIANGDTAIIAQNASCNKMLTVQTSAQSADISLGTVRPRTHSDLIPWAPKKIEFESCK